MTVIVIILYPTNNHYHTVPYQNFENYHDLKLRPDYKNYLVFFLNNKNSFDVCCLTLTPTSL